MDYLSVCSGIEAATVAWEPLGFKAVAFCEIDAFPSAVLAHHWPLVPNIGSMLSACELLRTGLLPPPAVLVGGTPCQSYSAAGKRAGLEDPRGQLTLAYVEILNTIDSLRGVGDECVCVWENVPGVLSDAGNAFGQFLGKLAGEDCELLPSGGKWSNAGCVFGPQRSIAWRVLDAQYFGVAQRRRRVFVVASARQGFDPCKVLFEFDGLRRDFAPSREAGQEVAGTLASRTTGCGFPGTDEARSGYLTMHGFNFEQFSDGGVLSPTLTATEHKGKTMVYPGYVLPTLVSNGDAHSGFRDEGGLVESSMSVRRLMPVECARLQGFPDNHCRIPYRNKPAELCPDSPQ